MIRLAVLFLTLLCISSANASQWGPGATTTTCIDWDSDGYGTGPGCTGVDGDDADGTVHTKAEIVAKHTGGTSASDGLSVFLSTEKGYTPLNYYYVATTGSDSTGTANNPALPWATIVGLRADHALTAGDIVIVRGGTYTDNWYLQYPSTTGTLAEPIIFMAYPGEKPVWDLVGDFSGDPSGGNDYLTFDGINFTNSATGQGRTFFLGSDNGAEAKGIIIRNCEVWNRANGIFAMQDLIDWVIEKNVFHHTDGGGSSHSIYLGARNHPCDNIIIRNNLLYNTGLTCAQMNGRATNYELSGNVCYNFKNASGFSLEMGVTGAHVYNNVVFNGTRTPLAIFNYPPPNQVSYPEVLPRSMTGNVIEHNTLIVSNKIYYNGTDNGVNYNITITNETPLEEEDIYTNTFRNNLLVNFTGGHGVFAGTKQVTYTPLSNACSGGTDYIDGTTTSVMFKANGKDPTDLIKTATIGNNIFYSSTIANVMKFYNIATACNTPHHAAPANVDTTLNWSQFTAHSATFTNNLNSDPLLEDTTASYYNTPNSFDFRVDAASPADMAGYATTVTTDIAGNARDTSNPTIGAFELGGGTPGGAASLNGGGNAVLTGSGGLTIQ